MKESLLADNLQNLPTFEIVTKLVFGCRGISQDGARKKKHLQ